MATAGGYLQRTAPSVNFGIEPRQDDDGLSAFAPVRPRLFGIAYRMLGSTADAEDIVQDVWLSWQSTDRKVVKRPSAFLATTTTRLCINVVQSAHSRREAQSESWHPEPVDNSNDPGLGAERSEALRFAVMLLLEKLSPTERTAYILREAFDYSYRQIADVLQMAEANTRQLVSRARRHILDGRCRPVSSGEQQRLLESFIAGAQGNIDVLESFFADDVVSYSERDRIVAQAGPHVWPEACGEVHCRHFTLPQTA